MTDLHKMCELEAERKTILSQLSRIDLDPLEVEGLAERLSTILFLIHEGKKQYAQDHTIDLE